MVKRIKISKSLREEVWYRVPGRCRICGKRLKKTAKAGEYGRWHAGHIVAHKNRGLTNVANLLPTCRDCNLVLKASASKRIKKILRLGVWGENEIRRNTKLGKQLSILYRNRKLRNARQRKLRSKTL